MVPSHQTKKKKKKRLKHKKSSANETQSSMFSTLFDAVKASRREAEDLWKSSRIPFSPVLAVVACYYFHQLQFCSSCRLLWVIFTIMASHWSEKRAKIHSQSCENPQFAIKKISPKSCQCQTNWKRICLKSLFKPSFKNLKNEWKEIAIDIAKHWAKISTKLQKLLKNSFKKWEGIGP